MMGEQFTVQLEGGSPWGFALQGGVDHRSPLRIGKVTPGGRAAKGGLLAGDYILTINGEECKVLKHLQAQQLVKKSKSSLILHCTKVRPGVTSPSPHIVPPSPTFSFPVTNGNKTPPIRNRLPSLTRPKPPPVPMTNGHARSGSLGMPSDTATNSATSASSPSSCSAMDAEDSKFLGMECSPGGLDHAQIQPSSVARKESPCSVPDSEVSEQENLVFALQQNDSMSIPEESKEVTPCLEQSGNDQNGNENNFSLNEPALQNQNEILKAVDQTEVDQDEASGDISEKTEPKEVGAETKEVGAEPNELEVEPKEVGEEPKEVGEEPKEVGEEPKEVGVQPKEVGVEPKEPNIESETETVSKVCSDDISGGVSLVVASGDSMGVAGSGSGVSAAEVEDSLSRKAPSSHSSTHGSRGGSFSKWDLVESITQAAQARSSRDSSMDLSSSFKSEDSSFDQHYQQQQQQQQQQKQKQQQQQQQQLRPQQKQQQQQQQQQQQYSSAGIPTGRPLPGPSSQTVIKPTLKVKKSSIDTREPGWYQQMFQTFSTKTDSDGEEDSSDSKDSSYTYDHRGLKVRKDSLGKASTEVQLGEAESKKREQSPSPESPLYVYDYRGLRVPAKKETAGQGGGHVRMGSTPAVMQGGSEKQPPQEKSSGRGTKFMSVSSAGTTKEDVIFSSKRQTSFKSQHYSTSNTRNYWKQKDQDHIHFDRERRKSQEVVIHRRNSSSDIGTSKMSSHIHPLLQAEEDDQSGTVGGANGGGNVLNRIDADKLHGALTNASMLGTLEQEGVPSHMLPAISQQNQLDAARKKEQDEKKKKLKPPPGPKALATFSFDGQTEKELSFEKGDFVDLTHLVDDNWLEGSVKGKTGIFPTSYVKVLSASEYAAMTASRPETPKQKAKALYEFKGQTDKEIDLEPGVVVTIERKVDDNWYSGTVGDRKGIFPVSYVQVIEN